MKATEEAVYNFIKLNENNVNINEIITAFPESDIVEIQEILHSLREKQFIIKINITSITHKFITFNKYKMNRFITLSDGFIARKGNIVVITGNTGGNSIGTITKIDSVTSKENTECLNMDMAYPNIYTFEQNANTLRKATKLERFAFNKAFAKVEQFRKEHNISPSI